MMKIRFRLFRKLIVDSKPSQEKSAYITKLLYILKSTIYLLKKINKTKRIQTFAKKNIHFMLCTLFIFFVFTSTFLKLRAKHKN